MGVGSEHDLGSVPLPSWGRVVAADGVVPWLLVDPGGQPVLPVRTFLRDFVAQGNRPGSVRSCAYRVRLNLEPTVLQGLQHIPMQRPPGKRPATHQLPVDPPRFHGNQLR